MNDRVKKLEEYLKKKKECFLIWMRTRSVEDVDEYRRIKKMVREATNREN